MSLYHEHLLTLFCFAILIVCVASGCAVQKEEKPKHAVFAHYMVCFATYGESVDGYKREIKEAQAAGIDGFALNEGAWSNEPHYVSRTAKIFQAAQELGTNFQLIFSLDLATLKPEYIPEIIKTYANHPNYYHYQGKPLVSTFSGGRNVDWTGIISQLKAEGIDICFVPFFYPDPVTEQPNLDAIKAHFTKWQDITDGLFFFGAAGTDEELTACNANYAKVAKEQGKLCMASYTPFYWGAGQPGRRFYETHGGEGIERQWKSIIDTNPDFVEIVTWNDFNESYLTPVDNPGQYFSGLKRPYRYNHAGYLELCKYYIDWYKTGKEPKVTRDGLFYYYRLHPKDAVAINAKPTEMPANYTDPAWALNPVTDRRGDVQDTIFVTTMLTAPAELRVTTGGKESRYPVAKGFTHTRIPFQPGAQHFELVRQGKQLLSADGIPVQAVPELYDFFPITGFAYAK